MFPKKAALIVPMLLAIAACASPFAGFNRLNPPAAKVEAITTVVPADIANKSDNVWALDLSSGGRVLIQLRPDLAPKAVERIKTLTRQGFYNGLVFHRVIDGFMAQGGDPKGTGEGGSPLPDLPAEFNDYPHVRGAVAMARAQDENSANSQFYIMFQPRFTLDRHYTVFGRVISGMNYVDALRRGEPPVAPSRIVQASLVADNRPQPAGLAEAPLPVAPAGTDLNSLTPPAQPPR